LGKFKEDGTRSHMGDAPIEEQAKMFGRFLQGTDNTFRVVKRKEWHSSDKRRELGNRLCIGKNTDYDGDTRHCSVLVNSFGNVCLTARGLHGYRYAMAYLYQQLVDGGEDAAEEAEELLVKIKALDKRGDAKLVVRHDCGHIDCCERRHLRIGTRTENERDKAFHIASRVFDANATYLEAESMNVKQILWVTHSEWRHLF